MKLQPDAAILLGRTLAAGRTPFCDSTLEDIRLYRENAKANKAPGPQLHVVEDTAIPSGGARLPIRLYSPSTRPSGLILFFHGGGWTVGSVDQSDATCRKLARATGFMLASVEYRLAPEHPFPAALDDARAALEWACRMRDAVTGLHDAPLVVLGESAGGNIALSAMLCDAQACEDVTLQVLVYPVVDSDLDTRSYRAFGEGTLLSRADMAWFWDNYCPDPALRADPRLSPVRHHDLSSLPSTLILSAECDPLASEGETLAARLATDGVPVEHLRYGGMIHGFFNLSDHLADGARAIDDVARRIAHCSDSKKR